VPNDTETRRNGPAEHEGRHGTVVVAAVAIVATIAWVALLVFLVILALRGLGV